MRQKHIRRTVAFFRKLSFRRIGATDYLAWSTWSDPPARTLNTEDDFDLPNLS